MPLDWRYHLLPTLSRLAPTAWRSMATTSSRGSTRWMGSCGKVAGEEGQEG